MMSFGLDRIYGEAFIALRGAELFLECLQGTEGGMLSNWGYNRFCGCIRKVMCALDELNRVVIGGAVLQCGICAQYYDGWYRALLMGLCTLVLKGGDLVGEYGSKRQNRAFRRIVCKVYA